MSAQDIDSHLRLLGVTSRLRTRSIYRAVRVIDAAFLEHHPAIRKLRADVAKAQRNHGSGAVSPPRNRRDTR